MRALREFVIKPDGTQRRARQLRPGVDGAGGGGGEKERRGKKIIRYRIDGIIDITGSLALYKHRVLNAEFH